MSFPKNPLCMKFFHSQVVLRCSNTSLQFYQSKMQLEHGKWTDMFVFTLTFTNLYSTSYVEGCMCTSYLGYTFLLGRILQKLCSRSLFDFKTDIVLCIHSVFCPWNIDFSSSFTITLTNEVTIFHRDTSADLLT